MHNVQAPEQLLRHVAAAAVLDAYLEGRPVEELRRELPKELEATGQRAAAAIVRSFFQHPALNRGLSIAA